MNPPENREAALSRYREGPALLEQAVAKLQEADLDARPSNGGWSIRQIVHHVVDGDDLWKLCVKMAIGNEQTEFTLGWYQSLTQETWADRWAYSKRPIAPSLSLFKATREHVLQLLESVPEAWNRCVSFRTRQGEIERIPVGFVIQMQGDHVFHHVERIRALLGERGQT